MNGGPPVMDGLFHGKSMKIPAIQVDDDWGYPYDSGNPHMCGSWCYEICMEQIVGSGQEICEKGKHI